MKSNFSLTNTASGKPERIAPGSTHLQRRQVLKGALGGVATLGLGSLGLSACGGSDAATAVAPTGVEFIGMTATMTDVQRAATFTSASVKISYSDASTKTQALTYNTLFKTGDTLKNGSANVIAGAYYDINGNPIMDTSGTTSEPFYSDCPDGNSLISLPNPAVAGVTGNTLFLVTQYEYKTLNNAGVSMYGKLPSPISITTLDQDKTTGALKAVKHFNVDTKPANGLWITCASSLSPWNTHLSSEEYEPDAANIASNTMFQEFSKNLYGSTTAANPYHYGHVPEVTVNPDGTASIVKHYCLGRIARELVEVCPDNKTVLMGDDGTNTGLFMFLADKEKDLSAGSLYVAKWTQTSATAGGAATLTWIKLGSATSAEIKTLADTLKASDIVTVKKTDPLDASYTKIAFNGATEWVKFTVGQEKAAAFLESHRYAAVMGGSMEFTKMEGVALNRKDKVAYIAISYIQKSMSDTAGDIQAGAISAGATYELKLSAGQKDKAGTAIGSDWVPTVMAAVLALVGEDLVAPDAVGNTANVDKVANPDNLKFSEKLRTLYIGEDSGMHVNNFLWAYNVDTKKLSRILSVPAGAESTGLQAVDKLNGFSYIMSNFQHAGDWTAIHSVVKVGADPLINANWNNKKSAAIGYLSGLPTL
ncbi:Twin-arginine translocation pathway signal [Rhodoferax ferrireducens T118]|uniref:Twin-arginine translocation pathway signal n=1 Tax=Albidiferax ferrireducens (strain ATCC BAA-621 / DSM 15236 / T118) TaxID=338969 RepID=Q21WV8_ALBFT|nr:alkaline phosphatase PhoX [Rhodoferax ferrireducens]ABD69745.1 Twin-arginine translocation pathway signal [Rhodoferax ferrireducens T118]